MLSRTLARTCWRPVRRCGFFLRPVAGAVLFVAPLLAQYGDARRGAELIERRSCTLCHSIRGTGGGTAPDLSRRSTLDFTPATLAASMWNHGPVMWRAMSARNLPVLSMGPTEIADLYAYFHSIRYFDPPGDAGRGKAVFSTKKCSTCHPLTPEEGKRPGPPVSRWPAIANRIRWSEHMWNHSGAMMAEIEKKGIRWPVFTLQEMVDLLVYLRNLPQRPDERPSLVFEDPVAGEKVFRERGCGRCHTLDAPETGKIELMGVARAARTFTELGVRMWNHLPQMRQRAAAVQLDFPTFSENEMSQMIAFLFAKRYFEEQGKPARGRAVFAARKCGSCHDQPGSAAPSLQQSRGQFSAHRMAAALWQHGPRMQGDMEKRGMPWPVFSAIQMADLIAFLNAR